MSENIALPSGYHTRPAEIADVQAVVDLLNTCTIERTGTPQYAADQLRSDWQNPDLNLETDTLLVIAPGGSIVGFAVLRDTNMHMQAFVDADVHPEHHGMGIGAALCGWIDRRGNQMLALASPEARVVMWQDRLSTDQRAGSLLVEYGYQIARHNLRMLIEMDQYPPEPDVPEGIVIRPFIQGEEEPAMIMAVAEAFRDHWGWVETPFDQYYQEWMYSLENDPDIDPSLWFVAVEGDMIAGTSFCYPVLSEDPHMGWIFALGVRRPWRKRGLGLALLLKCFRALYRVGKPKVALFVDADSLTGATRLYEKAGMHLDRQHDVYEKILRPGDSGSLPSVESEV